MRTQRLQALDPAGVAARDLRECLLLQLRELDAATPWLPEAQRLCEFHLNSLGNREFNQVMRKMKLGQDELREVMAEQVGIFRNEERLADAVERIEKLKARYQSVACRTPPGGPAGCRRAGGRTLAGGYPEHDRGAQSDPGRRSFPGL